MGAGAVREFVRLEVFALHASLVAAFAVLNVTDITRLTQITATGFPSDGTLANGASLVSVQGVAWSAYDAALYLSDAYRHTVFAIDRVTNSSVYRCYFVSIFATHSAPTSPRSVHLCGRPQQRV